MATTTTNLGLRKPDPTDTVNVTTDLNNNYDTIDAMAAFVTPASIGTANAHGTSTALARADHVHAGLGAPLALTGATAATRYVGATTSGAPASGTFAVGDLIIDQTGKVYVCTVAGTPGTWVAASGVSTATFWSSHTWAISGAIAVPSAGTNFIPPMTVFAGDTQAVDMVYYSIRAGTSVTFDLKKNGTNMTGFTSLSATTTPAQTNPADVALTSGDSIAPVVSAVSGSPDGLSISVIIKHTVTLT